ncbi:hypothetical protein CPC08DRAFT_754627 [Agrocybe pediades]|nr:hypothetical protein CPC08DRAFT_754627 [Agrocybe pediades]
MSTADDFPLSVTQQKTLISSDLNPTLLLQFLFGIYTGLFPATIYIYAHKENRTKANDRIIFGNITALYISTTLYMACNWLYTDILYGTEGTRVDMVVESIIGAITLGAEIILEVTSFAVFLFADVLLVWRCFHSCGRSIRRSSIPIALLVVEIVLALIAVVYRCLVVANPNFGTVKIDGVTSHLSAAAFVAAATTSLVSTVVICVQLLRRALPSSQSRKHYQTIINLLIESSAFYTAALIVLAVVDFNITGAVVSSYRAWLASKYVGVATQMISGMAPTLMISRLFMSRYHENTQVSSACLPSDLANLTSNGNDLELQQRESVREAEQDSEEIQVESRSEHSGP